MSTQIDVAKENTKVEQIGAKLFAGEFNGLPIVNIMILSLVLLLLLIY